MNARHVCFLRVMGCVGDTPLRAGCGVCSCGGGEVRDSRFCCGGWQKRHAGKVRVSGTGAFAASVVSGSYAAPACGGVSGNPCLSVRMRFRRNTTGSALCAAS